MHTATSVDVTWDQWSHEWVIYSRRDLICRFVFRGASKELAMTHAYQEAARLGGCAIIDHGYCDGTGIRIA